ncbi:MAG: DedA family protein [Patescibacteria group bacterium]|nr:DedA family protein [Patescibacteria group bacterium]
MQQLLASITSVFSGAVVSYGYLGILVLMFFETANVPVPSEVIMPFAGFLASQNLLIGWLAVAAGVAGNVLGALTSYSVAGKIDHHLQEKRSYRLSEKWFKKYGDFSVFFGQLVPVVRTFISFPAGIFKMKKLNFLCLTTVGSIIWSSILVYTGLVLGSRWATLEPAFGRFNFLIGAILVLGILFGAWYHFTNNK